MYSQAWLPITDFSVIDILLSWSSFNELLTIPHTHLILLGQFTKKLWLTLHRNILERKVIVSTKVPPREKTLALPKSIIEFQFSTCPSISKCYIAYWKKYPKTFKTYFSFNFIFKILPTFITKIGRKWESLPQW